MCDYSLESYVSRPAKVGERLRTYTFPSGSAGMVGIYEGPNGPPTLLAQAMRMLKTLNGDWDFGCAVCLEPGTELMFSEPIRFAEHVFNVASPLGHAAAKFVQLNIAQSLEYTPAGKLIRLYWHNGNKTHERDAIELPDGSRYLFRDLEPAQNCTVVQLPAQSTDNYLHREASLQIPQREGISQASVDEQRHERARVTAAIDALYSGQ